MQLQNMQCRETEAGNVRSYSVKGSEPCFVHPGMGHSSLSYITRWSSGQREIRLDAG